MTVSGDFRFSSDYPKVTASLKRTLENLSDGVLHGRHQDHVESWATSIAQIVQGQHSQKHETAQSQVKNEVTSFFDNLGEKGTHLSGKLSAGTHGLISDINSTIHNFIQYILTTRLVKASDKLQDKKVATQVFLEQSFNHLKEITVAKLKGLTAAIEGAKLEPSGESA